MESYGELRDRLTQTYGFVGPKVLAPVEIPEKVDIVEKETAFVIAPPGSDKMYVTGRVKAEHWETPVNRAFTYVTGRFVQAEKANLNGAFWAAEDLQFGHPSVAFGPVNLLHDEKAIIGTISEAHLHEQDPKYGTHMTTMNVLWKYLFPQAVQAVEKASTSGELWQSMECIGEQIQCMGCDETFDYGTWMRNRASGCEHLSNGGVRRIVRPTFLASGIILGSSRPAWADADVELRKEAAKVTEENELTEEFAEQMVAQILTWAKRGQ